MYVRLNKKHSWHMLGCDSARKFSSLSLLVNQLASWIDVFSMTTTKCTGLMKPWSKLGLLSCLT